MEKPRSQRRRGVGVVLVTVIVVAFFILVLGLAQSFFGTQVSNLALRGASGGICEDLAESAIATAYWVVSSKLNDSSGNGAPYYESFRTNVGSFDLTIPKSDLAPFYSTCLAEWADYELVDDEVTGRVLYQIPALVNSGLADISPLQPGLADETFGSLQFSARVRHSVTGVVRTVTHCYAFKKSLNTVPRPFDFLTFAVLQPSSYINALSPFGDANKGIKASIDGIKAHYQQAGEMIDRINRAISKIKDAISGTFVSKSQKKKGKRAIAALEKMRDQYVKPLRNDVPEITVHAANESYGPDPRKLHFFPVDGDDRAGGAMFLHSAEKNLELEPLNLPKKLYEQQQKIDEQLQKTKTAYQRLDTSMKQAESAENPNVPLTDGSLENWCSQIRALWKVHEDMLLQVYRDFQERFVETASPATYGDLLKSFRALSPRAMMAKATVRFVEGGSRDVSQQLADFLDKKCDGAFSGIVYVSNSSQELVIDRQFKGRIVLYVDGAVKVRRCTRADPSRDMVSIVALGDLSIEGPTEANLVALKGFENLAGTTVQGSLFLKSFAFADSSATGFLDDAARVFKGKLVFNEKSPSGSGSNGVPAGDVYRDALTVSLGPDVIFKAVQRK